MRVGTRRSLLYSPIDGVKQDFLLGDMSTYDTSADPGPRTEVGREFMVLANAKCYGLRLKHAHTSSIGIRLYRVSDQRLLSARDGLSVIAGVVTELLFSTPVTLRPYERYRICRYDPSNDNYYRLTGNDQPDGTVTSLTMWTANIGHNAAGGDDYPVLQTASVSFAGEPIIYTTGAVADAVQPVIPQLDNFTGTGALAAHTPDVGGPWNVIQGSFTDLAGGLLTYTTVVGAGNAAAVLDAGAGNCEITCAFKGGADKGGVVFRSAINGLQRFSVIPNTTTGRIYCYRYTDASTKVDVGYIGQAWTAGDDHTLTLFVRNSVLRLLFDGTYIGNLWLTPAHASNAWHGVGTRGGSYTTTEISWDSFQVAALTGWRDILVIGDSISNDNGNGGDLAKWPHGLTVQYNGARAWPLNYAVGASHIESVTNGTGMMSQIELSRYEAPTYTIIMLGVNDLAGIGTLTAKYLACLEAHYAYHPTTPIYCCKILNTTYITAEQRTAINGEIAAAVTAADLLGVDVTLWDTDGWIDPATDCDDGLHPNAAGHAKIATAMLALLPE